MLHRSELEYVCTSVQIAGVIDELSDPAHDLQAMDRAYRFGQTRDVFVYRLLGAGSIEELIYARQVYKQQQMAIGYNASVQTRYFAGISGDKKRQGELFGLKNIFAFHEDNWSTKMAVRHSALRCVVLRASLTVVPQIEHANIFNLDWALAHMDAVKSKKTRRRTGTAEDWVYEAEMKDTIEDVGAVLRYAPGATLTPRNVGRSQGSWSPTFGRQYASCQSPESSPKCQYVFSPQVCQR